MHFHIVKMHKDKEVNKYVKNIFLSMCDVKVFLTFTSLNLSLPWQLFYLFCSSIVINTAIVTAGTFEPEWKREVWRFKIWFNPPFLKKCLYQVRVITVFTVFRLLTDFVCLYTYEFWLSLCKIVRSSVILLLPLFTFTERDSNHNIILMLFSNCRLFVGITAVVIVVIVAVTICVHRL
jgi:hypothetical protein